MDIKNTITIVDWDDTIFPTTWFQQQNYYLSNNIDKFDIKCSLLFCKFLRNGKVIIISYATRDWINYSLKFLPKLKNLIDSFSIKIIARDNVLNVFNADGWKKKTFKNEILQNQQYTNIISIGDSDAEYSASIALNKIISGKHYIKTIRCIPMQSIDTMKAQIEILIEKMDDIYSSESHKDLIFEID